MPDLPPSFGNVTGEYVALRDEAAVVVGLHELVWVRGEDTVTFLQGILSQDVESAPVGSVRRTLLLQPNGKLTAIAWLLKGADEVGLVVDAGLGETVATTLNRYRIRVKASIEPDLRPVREVWGRQAAAALVADGLPAPAGWQATADGAVIAFVPLGGLPRYFVLGAELSPGQAGALAAHAIRVEAGVPVMGRDVSESTIPQESGLTDSTVSFAKGCYLGQELVARIDSRGHVNRRLVGVVIGENVVPPEGATLLVGDREVGTLTSPAESLTLRAPIGLALIRREVAAGDEVEVRWSGGNTRAQVRELPLSTFAPS